METAGQNLQRLCIALARHPVHQAMLAIDPPRPPARQVALQWLRLAGAGERVAQALGNQRVDARHDRRIFRLPLHIVRPRG